MLRLKADRKMDLMSYHLAWAADLHLEFLSPEKFDRFLQSLRDVRADGLLICGDISTSPRLRQNLVALSTIGKPVYFVCGNHDYYRGSFKKTSDLVGSTCREHRGLRWLSLAEIIPLTSTTALMGHEGWGDGRGGLGVRTSIGMNDFVLIEDLRTLEREQLFAKLEALGRASARYAEDVIARAARRFDHLIFATHVPPFVEAVRYQGAPTSPDFLPFYVNVVLEKRSCASPEPCPRSGSRCFVAIRTGHLSTTPHQILKFGWQVPATAIPKWKASFVSEAAD